MKTVTRTTTITSEGTLLLEDLPLRVGDEVKVIVRLQGRGIEGADRYPLQGTPYSFTEPFDGVAVQDWEAGR
jgi:hypothetical protein